MNVTSAETLHPREWARSALCGARRNWVRRSGAEKSNRFRCYALDLGAVAADDRSCLPVQELGAQGAALGALS